MPITTTLDKEKLLQSLLYIAYKAPGADIYHVPKILYFAEKRHLQTYGRLICGSTYAKLPLGPVPSEAYDMLKALCGTTDIYFVSANPQLVERARTLIHAKTENTSHPCFYPLAEPNTDIFSKSDLKCLNAAIEEIGPLSFEDLKQKSHDQVYDAAREAKKHFIPLEIFASALPNREAILEYLEARS